MFEACCGSIESIVNTSVAHVASDGALDRSFIQITVYDWLDGPFMHEPKCSTRLDAQTGFSTVAVLHGFSLPESVS